MRKKFKVFLDTSVLLSGLNSSVGASALIVSLFKLKRIDLVISPEVIDETERNISKKFPLLKDKYRDFLYTKPSITKPIFLKEVKNIHKIMRTEDTPILAGALKSNADYLITLDKKFQSIASKSDKAKDFKLKILSPGEFLKKFKESITN